MSNIFNEFKGPMYTITFTIMFGVVTGCLFIIGMPWAVFGAFFAALTVAFGLATIFLVVDEKEIKK